MKSFKITLIVILFFNMLCYSQSKNDYTVFDKRKLGIQDSVQDSSSIRNKFFSEKSGRKKIQPRAIAFFGLVGFAVGFSIGHRYDSNKNSSGEFFFIGNAIGGGLIGCAAGIVVGLIIPQFIPEKEKKKQEKWPGT